LGKKKRGKESYDVKGGKVKKKKNEGSNRIMLPGGREFSQQDPGKVVFRDARWGG